MKSDTNEKVHIDIITISFLSTKSHECDEYIL